MIWLLVLGLIYGWAFIWPGDILYHYAIVGLMLIPFRKAPLKVVGGLIVLFIAVTMLSAWLKENSMNEIRKKGIAAEKLEQVKQTMSEEQKADLEKWKALSSFTTMVETAKFHGTFFFDIIIFMLLSILAFRTGLLTSHRSEKFYWILLVVRYVNGFGWGYLQKAAVLRAGFDPFLLQKENIFPVSLYQVHRIGTTLGHMSLQILMWKNGAFTWILHPLSKMGQMAFTNYLGQSIIYSLFFYGYGLGY